LRERERDHADGEKQKQEERTSKKMRIDGRVMLLFHFCLILRNNFWVERPFYGRTRKNVKTIFVKALLTAAGAERTE